MKPNETSGFFTRARDVFTQKLYEVGDETHLGNWREVVKAFNVSGD